MLVLEIIFGLLILVLLVVVHELGHAIVAHRNGVVVEEFGIGFPPKAWGKKLKNGVLFSLNWLPLGGFVRLKGEHDAATGKGTYGGASFWLKTKILLAGVAMNWVVAAVLLSILAVFGLPKILPDQFSLPADTTIVRKPLQIVTVEAGSPAQKAGLKTGDELLRLNGLALPTSEQLVKQTELHKGETVELIYGRGGVEYSTRTTLRGSNDDKRGYLGVASGQREEIKATWSAPIVGIATTGQFTWATLSGTAKIIGQAVKGVVLSLVPNKAAREVGNKDLATVSGSVAGPVGILGTIFPAAEKAGPTQLVFLTAIISLSLAVMNALPIPALDGGRW